MITRTLIGLSLLFTSCSERTETNFLLNASDTLQSLTCTPPDGIDAWLTGLGKHTAVFGELHGTREAPAAIAEIVCEAAKRGPTLLAVEWPASDDVALRTAWKAPKNGLQDALDLHLPGWSDDNTGVRSQALLDMLVRLHNLKSEGLPITIAAFNGARDDTQAKMFEELPGQEPHEMLQATNIDALVSERDYTHAFVLVGNVHAKKTLFTQSEPHWEPMAMKLMRLRPIKSLLVTHDGGQSWNCRLKPDFDPEVQREISEDDIICGASDSSYNHDGSELAGIGAWPNSVADSTLKDNYDGYIHVGRITASPPVRNY